VSEVAEKPERVIDEVTRKLADQYAVVLIFVHWAMNEPQGKTVSLGELMQLGCEANKLPPPPAEIEEALMRVAFRLASQNVPFTRVMA